MAKKRILIVDDSATLRQWGQMVLESAGFEVVATDNPVLVPRMMFRGNYDLVLLDLSMPLLDGDHVASIMKDAHISTLIIFHSTRSEEDLEETTKRCGAHGFIKKGSDSAKFVAQVNRFLDGKQ